MSKPVFESKMMGCKVKVFPNRVSYTVLFTEKSIPINQIASIDLGVPLYGQISIETTGGVSHKINVKPGQKEALRDAIYEQM